MQTPPPVGEGDGVGAGEGEPGPVDLEPDGCGAGEDGRGPGPVVGGAELGCGAGDLAAVGTADRPALGRPRREREAPRA
jgi:hypothetical protein